MTDRRKLIEVALPLEAINEAAAHEKSIRHGHPSALHPWWARRPLAACRAVLFAQLVDDPSAHPERFPTVTDQEAERERLFQIIRRLVLWESTSDEAVLAAARAEIAQSCGPTPPPVFDPFAGSGTIPLEAQRLGMPAEARDINPVAVLITQALTQIPARFRGRPPVHAEPADLAPRDAWRGAAGLAHDVNWYGSMMCSSAKASVGHLYADVAVPAEMGGGHAQPIAWLWCRTVTCPNPSCRGTMPLVRSFDVSTQKGKEASLEPVIDRDQRRVHFRLTRGQRSRSEAPKVGRGAKFRCLICGNVADDGYLREEGMGRRLGSQLLAFVADIRGKRLFLEATPEEEARALQIPVPTWTPSEELADDPRNLWCKGYGVETFAELFTTRQLTALGALADGIRSVRNQVLADATRAGLPSDGVRLRDGGTGAQAYADAIAVYLGLAASKATVFSNQLARWRPGDGWSAPGFGRQAIPMVWDFAEINPFCGAGGDFLLTVTGMVSVIERLSPAGDANVDQADATHDPALTRSAIVCTDPPYYDNIAYANLADFFYVWLRHSLGEIEPRIFGTMVTPKNAELVATPYRFEGGQAAADRFFEEGLSQAFQQMCRVQDPAFPLTVFYAFRQAESDSDGGGTASTGWETMLEALLGAGLSVTGTWPLRTEGSTRLIAMGTNALASSILLVCRPRPQSAGITDRKGLLAAMRRELPDALRTLQQGNIAPVDLAQAAIGPGMAIFTRYARVIEPDGSQMRVRMALTLINQVLDTVLTEQEGEFDADTRWSIGWFEQYGFDSGPYGVAETLSRARNTSVAGLVEAGVVEAKAGLVHLIARNELPRDWDPASDARFTVWEATHQLIRRLDDRGEEGAAALLQQLGGVGDRARDLAYRLYAVCERKGWARDATAFNTLVLAWPEISRLAASGDGRLAAQQTLL